MKRLHKTLITALVVFGAGSGAAIWTLREKVKTPEERFRQEQDAKRLFRFGRSDVKTARLFSPSATIALSRDEFLEWTLTEPVRWTADTAAVEALLDRMVAMKADPLLSEAAPPALLGEVGLDRPKISLEVELKDGRRETLFVGPRNALEDKYPVADGSKQRVGLSEPSFHWAFDRPAADFREKRLFPFAEGSVNRVEVSRGDGTPVFQLTRTSSAWSVLGPDQPETPADSGAVSLFLVRLTQHLKVRAFLTNDLEPNAVEARRSYGLEPGALVVTVTPSRGSARRVRFGALAETSDTQGTAVAQLEGSSSVVELDGALRDELAKDAKSFLDRTVLRFDHRAVARVTLVYGAETPAVLERSQERWQLKGSSARPVTGWKVDAIVRGFAYLKAERPYAEAPSREELRDWLLEPAARRLIFEDTKGIRLGELAIGASSGDTEVLARVPGRPRVDVIPAQKARLLPERPQDLVEAR